MVYMRRIRDIEESVRQLINDAKRGTEGLSTRGKQLIVETRQAALHVSTKINQSEFMSTVKYTLDGAEDALGRGDYELVGKLLLGLLLKLSRDFHDYLT